jgi:hypothetical protein
MTTVSTVSRGLLGGLLALLAACGPGGGPAALPIVDAPPPARDTLAPFPIDGAGPGSGAPQTYRGLPLELVERPSPTVTAVDGVIGVVCVGMSNASQECLRLIAATTGSGPWRDDVAPNVVIVNCAVGGQAIERWNDPQYDAQLWDHCINTRLPARGLRVDQVRVILHKAAHMFGVGPGGAPLPLLPDPASNYARFQQSLGTFAARVPAFFPNVQAVYTSSRSYGGYTTRWERGEPQAYEEGHALNRWLASHATVGGVWQGWWGYLWAPDCATGVRNGGGVCYERADYQADAVHPTAAGEIKIARLQHERLLREPWYRR